MKFVKNLVFFIIFFLPTLSTASVYHWKFFIDAKEQSIADGETTVNVDDWICTIGKAIPEDTGKESRRIGCSVNGGLQAYLYASCFKIKKNGKIGSEPGLLNLQMKKTTSRLVGLICE